MYEIKKPALAGTLESSDAQVIVAPNPKGGLEITIESPVKAQFGRSIKTGIEEVLATMGVRDATITVTDKGAIDAVIRARLMTAVCRAAEERLHAITESKPVCCAGSSKHNGLRRSSLYASGSSPAHMIQTQFYNQDCIVYDLEDSVSLEEKDAARILIYTFLQKHRPGGKQIVIRTNAIDSVFFAEDLEACVRLLPDAVRLPKVESADEVKKVAERMTAIEKTVGIPEGSVAIWCNIETYMGVLNAREIAKASPRVVAMAISAEDFTASMKAERTKEGWEIFHARNAVLMACREAGIDALDAVFSDFDDVAGLTADTQWGKRLGFDGKTLIHPKQVDPVNAVFTPSQKEINHALRVFDAIEEAKRNKKGAISLDGSMLDEAVVIRSRRTIALAKAAGIAIEGVEDGND
ncbi:MAG: Citrate lyase acyl carrier protein [Desulfovibrio sp.]